MLAIISENVIDMQNLLEKRGGVLGAAFEIDTCAGILRTIHECKLKDICFYYLPFNGICEGISFGSASVVCFSAFKKLGVTDVISVGLVGGINPLINVCDIVVPDDFIDFTKSRFRSIIELESPGVHHHFRSAHPFCSELRRLLVASARLVRPKSSNVFYRGTYVCTEGPRFETRAEVNMFRNIGADITGLTVAPEVIYARELNMCYANVSIVLDLAENWDDFAWENIHHLSEEQRRTLNGNIALDVVEHYHRKGKCNCQNYWIRRPSVLRPGEDRMMKV